MTTFGWYFYHFGLTWIPFAPQTFQWIHLLTKSCLFLYSFWASLGNSLTIWLTVSSALLHTQHFVYSCDVSIFPLIILVWMACSCPEHIKLFVLCFRVPFCNHCHLSWFLTFLVCRTTWPYNIFFLLFLLLVPLSLYCSL